MTLKKKLLVHTQILEVKGSSYLREKNLIQILIDMQNKIKMVLCFVEMLSYYSRATVTKSPPLFLL